MSCSSIRQRFEHLVEQGGINFEDAITLYNDLRGSIEAHKIEFQELQQIDDPNRIEHLRQHIDAGEQMLNYLRSIIIR